MSNNRLIKFVVLSLTLQVIIIIATTTSSSPGISSFYDLAAVDTDGNLVQMSKYRGKVTLVVNVASNCGLTHLNYRELAQLHHTYQEHGFEILAFPSNQFGSQEPGTNQEIVEFVKQQYPNVKFPLYAKTTVNGWCPVKPEEGCKATSDTCCGINDQIYANLKQQHDGAISWNFEKFLLNKNGYVVERYHPEITPKEMEEDIVNALSQSP